MTDTPVFRSLLFLPADRQELVPKLDRYRPDAAVLDLEDAVAEAGKAAARAAIADSAGLAARLGITCLVRVNPAGTPHFAADLTVAARSAAAGVVLPKYERAGDLAAVRERLGPDRLIVVGVETVRGVADARPLLAGHGSGTANGRASDAASGPASQAVHGQASAVYFGAEDYIADIGGRRTAGGAEVLYARSAVVAAAHLAGLPAIDQAVVDFRDDDLFIRDAEAGRDLGYTGKICIHPRQAELARRVFTPSAAEAAQARRVLAAGASGVAALDGQMIDEPHLRQARRTLARYDQAFPPAG